MHSIDIQGKTLVFEVRPSQRARRLGLTVYPGGRIVLTKPVRATPESTELFIRKYADWILKAHARHARVVAVLPGGKRDYVDNKSAALHLVQERLSYFNQQYGYKIGKISIRNNRSRWGSCTRRGDLSFNYKIVHLEPELQDYIVVHELCHIGQFDHSSAFWTLVEKAIPDHKVLRKRLRLIAH